jgi:hypothetical protein
MANARIAQRKQSRQAHSPASGTILHITQQLRGSELLRITQYVSALPH